MPKKALIIHDSRGLGVAAAAETKHQLNLDGFEVDTYASFLETGLPANFYEKTIGAIQTEVYDQIIVLNIALDIRDPMGSLQKLKDLNLALSQKGKSFKYIDTHDVDPGIMDNIAEFREKLDIVFRERSVNAALEGDVTERMIIGAISDRDCDENVLEKLSTQRSKIATGLDIAARGDFQGFCDKILSPEKKCIKDETEAFFLALWEDEVIPENLLHKIIIFEKEAKKIIETEGKQSVKKKIQNLILKTFSSDFVKRAVNEMEKENYEWFLRLAKREPVFKEVEWALPVGDLTVLTLADPRSSWGFKALDKAVEQNGTKFGILFLKEANDNRGVEKTADLITIIKNWRILPENSAPTRPNTVREISKGILEEDVFAKARGRENNITFRLEEGDLRSIKIFSDLLKAFAGIEISEELAEPLLAGIKIYANILKKASMSIKALSKEYLGEEYAQTTNSASEQLTLAAVKILKEMIEALNQKSPTRKYVESLKKKLETLDINTEITANIIRILPREDVSSLDISKIKATKTKKIPGTDLKLPENEDVMKQIMEIIRVQFPEGDDSKFREVVMEDNDSEVIISLSNNKVLAFFVMSKNGKTHHPDWFMANPDAPIKGLGEATLMWEINSLNSSEKIEAEVEPQIKTSDICIEELGFVAHGDTKGDENFKKRYLRISRDSNCEKYLGKLLSAGEVDELISQFSESGFRKEKFYKSLRVVKVKMPEDNEYVLDLMSGLQEEYVLTRYIKDPKTPSVRYCVFENKVLAELAA